jgi:hypothetical protein
MEQKKEQKTELKLTLAGIHSLYIDGKISLSKHNEWCRQACEGATSFSL